MANYLPNETELISAAQAGDRAAFDRLMSSCYQPTFRLAVGIVRNREDAEDVLQEAMIKAYCNLKQFQQNSRFYTWVVRIAINEALMNVRKRHGDRQVSLDDEVTESDRGMVHRECEDWSNSPEKFCAQRELNGLLDDRLTGLSPRLGVAFYLHNVEDLSIRDTAVILGLSVNATKSRVFRACSRLRQRLTAVLREPGRCSSKPRRRRAQPRIAAGKSATLYSLVA
jgi:RNA polymerase sigma-70 factor, ECF subfamily